MFVENPLVRMIHKAVVALHHVDNMKYNISHNYKGKIAINCADTKGADYNVLPC